MDGDGGGGDSEAPHIDRSLPMSRLYQGEEEEEEESCRDAAELEETGGRKREARHREEEVKARIKRERGRGEGRGRCPLPPKVIHQDEKCEQIVEERDPELCKGASPCQPDTYFYHK